MLIHVENLRQAIVDVEHLRMLTLGYYRIAGMGLLFSLFGGMYMAMGLMFTFPVLTRDSVKTLFAPASAD